jgi:hypothetical protein
MKSILFFALQSFILSGLFVSPTDAFQAPRGTRIVGRRFPSPPQTQRTTLQAEGANVASIACLKLCSSIMASSRPGTALFAGKQKKPVEPPKEVDGLRMLLAYATPWRNPNSIFVYMILILYLLGTYSEAQSAAGGSL